MTIHTLSGPTLLPNGEIQPRTVRLEGAIIAEIRDGLDPTADLTTTGYLAPGLLDLQLNGAWGADFTTDGTTVAAVAQQLPQTGVTGFLPTVITSPFGEYAHRLEEIAAASGGPGAHVLGVHLEGPYLNPRRKGAHNPALLRPITLAEVTAWAEHPLVRLVTLAPELANAPAMIEQLAARGIVVSAGHSDATYAEALAGFAAGIQWGTHLFNAMRDFNHREPGLTGALLTTAIQTGVIADGVHVHPAALRLAFHAKGAEQLTLVTDAMAAMGMPAGRYHLSDRTVLVDERAARLEDGTLAGSILMLDQAVRNMVTWTGCSVGTAWQMASANPARLLGLTQKGRIATGCDADLVLLDSDLQVSHTLVGGQLLWSR